MIGLDSGGERSEVKVTAGRRVGEVIHMEVDLLDEQAVVTFEVA